MVDDSIVVELMRSVFRGLRRTNDGLRRTDEEFAGRRPLPMAPEPVGHPGGVTSHDSLVGADKSAGQTAEAIETLERRVMDRAQTLGVDHPVTLADRAKLGSAYQNSGRISEAIAVYKALLAEPERVFGVEHLDVLFSRDELADACCVARRGDDAIAILEQLLTDRTRICGVEHASTRDTRAKLAAIYLHAGREGGPSALHGARAEPSCVTLQGADGNELSTAQAVVTAVQSGLIPRLIAIATCRGLPTVNGDGSAMEALQVNEDLVGDAAYSESEGAQVKSWLKLLNELTTHSEGSASLSDARAAAVIAAVRVFLDDHSADRYSTTTRLPLIDNSSTLAELPFWTTSDGHRGDETRETERCNGDRGGMTTVEQC